LNPGPTLRGGGLPDLLEAMNTDAAPSESPLPAESFPPEPALPPEAPLPLNPPLQALEARVLGCLIEKEFCTPDIYPLTLNALVNACNQKSNRDPVISAGSSEVEVAIERLRDRHLVAPYSGAVARVQKYKQRLEEVIPMEPAARAMIAELMLRGPQTAAGLRSNSARMLQMPDLVEVDAILANLAARPSGALVCRLERQHGQKEARWAQLLTGKPEQVADNSHHTPAEPLKVEIALPPDAEARLTALEKEVVHLRAELARLRSSLGEGFGDA